MQKVQPLTDQLPPEARDEFRQAVVNSRERYKDPHSFWLAIADLFEKQVGIQTDLTLPTVGQKLEIEIFEEQLLGNLPEAE